MKNCNRNWSLRSRKRRRTIRLVWKSCEEKQRKKMERARKRKPDKFKSNNDFGTKQKLMNQPGFSKKPRPKKGKKPKHKKGSRQTPPLRNSDKSKSRPKSVDSNKSEKNRLG